MRIIVAGSREFGGWDKNSRAYTNPDHVQLLNDRLDLARDRRAAEGDTVVIISGTCYGPDDLGERWADKTGHEVIRKPANWDKYGKRAGPLRNEEMGAIADAAIIFWNGTSRGTKNMINICKRLGIPHEIIRF